MKVNSIKPVINLYFWQKCYYLKLEEQKLSEQEQIIWGTAKFSKFEDNATRLTLDESSFNSQYALQWNTFYELKVPGLMKIVNKKEQISSEDSQISSLVKEYMEQNQPVFFFLMMYIDHKNFVVTYNFYEISFISKFNSIVSAIDPVISREVQIDEDSIVSTNGFVLNRSEAVFCDTSVGNNVSKLILNYIIQNEKDLKSFFLVKTPLNLSQSQTKPTLSLMKFSLQENFASNSSPSPVCKPIF